jgi:hypothetical protein
MRSRVLSLIAQVVLRTARPLPGVRFAVIWIPRTRTSRGASGLVLAMMAGALSLSLAGPVAAGDQVPFRGNLDGTVIVTPIVPPLVSVQIEGTGVATQLGSFTVGIPHLANQATRVAVGSYLFTAANGDTLTANFTGPATLVAPGVLSIAETGVITGGTGRFAGATGSFTGDRMFFLATGVTTGSFTGTVSSPGSTSPES